MRSVIALWTLWTARPCRQNDLTHLCSRDLTHRLEERECNQTWKERNPGYWRDYRKSHTGYVERNRLLQKGRRAGANAFLFATAAAKRDPFTGTGAYLPIPEKGVAEMDAFAQESCFGSGNLRRSSCAAKEDSMDMAGRVFHCGIPLGRVGHDRVTPSSFADGIRSWPSSGTARKRRPSCVCSRSAVKDDGNSSSGRPWFENSSEGRLFPYVKELCFPAEPKIFSSSQSFPQEDVHYVKKPPDRVDLGAGEETGAGPQATVLNGERGGHGWKEQEIILIQKEKTGPNRVKNPKTRCGKGEAKVKLFRSSEFITIGNDYIFSWRLP